MLFPSFMSGRQKEERNGGGSLTLLVKTDGCREFQITPRANRKILLIGNGRRPNVPDSEYVQIHDPALNSCHCLLTRHRTVGWKIEKVKCDVGCHTTVNGTSLENPQKLVNEDLVRIGNTVLKIKIGL